MTIEQNGSGTADQVKDQANQIANSAQDQAAQLAGRAHEQAGQIADRAQDTLNQAQSRLRDQIEQRSSDLGNQISQQASDLRAVRDSLREQGKEGPAQAADRLAGYADQVGSYLSGRDVDTLISDAEDFGRRRPWAVGLGGLALGFAGARFLKASSQERYRSRTTGSISRSSGVTGTGSTSGGFSTGQGSSVPSGIGTGATGGATTEIPPVEFEPSPVVSV